MRHAVCVSWAFATLTALVACDKGSSTTARPSPSAAPSATPSTATTAANAPPASASPSVASPAASAALAAGKMAHCPNIVAGANTKPTWTGKARHVAYSAGGKKFERVWDVVINAQRLPRALPVLEGVLSGLGRVRPRRAATADSLTEPHPGAWPTAAPAPTNSGMERPWTGHPAAELPEQKVQVQPRRHDLPKQSGSAQSVS